MHSIKVIRRKRLFSAFIFTFRWQKSHLTGSDKLSLSDWMPSRNHRLSIKYRFLHERNFQLFLIKFNILERRMIRLVDWLSWERTIIWRGFSNIDCWAIGWVPSNDFLMKGVVQVTNRVRIRQHIEKDNFSLY